MKSKSSLALALVAAAFVLPVQAQPAAPSGSAVVASEPGKAVAAATVEVSAQVAAIDKATRTVTLKTAKGESHDVVAGPEVKNFDQIKVGDTVTVRYLEALTLELRKSTAKAPAEPVIREEAAKAKPGEKPAAAGARQVSLTAQVTAVDPAKKTISLKGPKGKVVTLDVRNPEQFKVVKVGDLVDVTYTQALAVAVVPTPKADAPKKAETPKK